jgi:dTDP-4-dehydrorhamnose reductase
MKILLTGRTGQVGRELHSLLPGLGELLAADRQLLDLAKPDQIRQAIRTIQPQLIVNAAAYTAVDQAEHDQANAEAINAIAPAILAEEAKKVGAILVHYSTDYVFDGSKRSPYFEGDPTNPLSVYGSTKLAGERSIQQSGAFHLIFRTAWVYATQGRNFLRTILRLATERQELRVVHDQIGAPTWAHEIAAGTVRVLSQICSGEAGRPPGPQTGGIYHMTAGGETNWHEFAQAILEQAAKKTEAAPWLNIAMGHRPLVTSRVIPITTNEFPAPARRPAYSVLSNRRLADAFGVQLPDWRSQLSAAFRTDI